jgi:two-component system sensor histidine kinase MprB
VAAAAIVGALTAGTAAAVTASIAVDRVVSRNNDQRLTGATLMLAGELREEEHEGEGETLQAILEDENSELEPSGIRLGVHDGDRLLAGSVDTPRLANDGCRTVGALGVRTRACAHRYGELTLVAAQRSDHDETRWLFLAAGLAALAIGGGVGIAAGGRLSRWALAPLSKLTSRIRTLTLDGAKPEDLGAPSDCAEVAAIQAAVVDLLQRLRRELDRTRRFAADAAHELRTPLTTLRAEIELLLEQRPETGAHELRGIARRSEQLAELVDRLLVLAAPLDDAAPGFETVAIADVVDDALAMLPPERARRVEVELQSEGLVRGDAALLLSLVNNALDNALKFSAEESVGLSVSESNGTVRVDVRDRGPGVRPDQRELVFQPFYRSRAGSEAGRGLGLALIAHISRAHGGRARFIDSEVGACLRIELPSWQPVKGALSPPDGETVEHASRNVDGTRRQP